MEKKADRQRRRVNGEGSIYQRASDGLWVASAYVYTTTGVMKRKPVYGRSFDEVREKLDRLKGDSANGIAVPDRAVTVSDYLTYWLAQVKEVKRATTWRGYESAVRLHIVPVLGKKRLEKLTGADVRHLVAACRAKCLCCLNGYDRHRKDDDKCCSAGKCCRRFPSKRQIQFIHAVLRNALSNAERDELVTRNVAKLVQIPTPRYKVGKGLQVSEVKQLLVEARKTRLYGLYVVAATLGLRRGELLGLRWTDVDLVRATLTVAQTVQRVGGRLVVDDTKSQASDATVPLPKITRKALLDHLARQGKERVDAGEIWQEHGLVFPTSVGTPMEPRSLNRHFDGIRTRAGLPGVRLHDFRHTVVSLLLALGTPPHVVQAIARHADLDITLSIYAHTNLDAMREALDQIDWDVE
ncbi:tyrosine-type recombinase/integrase [Pseudonocardia sp. GCM10023141]|uniref:tyrosine-type recombinase/integrase n=1 Tax=Pseudonocardia sp. GCM10023141 TaxID=3252653 RepID=UPI00360D7CC4